MSAFNASKCSLWTSRGKHSSSLQIAAAMPTISPIVPVVFIYIFQKYLLVGMTFGTVRGEV